MKPVLLSADVRIYAYMVPDDVADHLMKYCNEFEDWNCEENFTEVNFIQWLNEKCFPDEKSWPIEECGFHRKDIPAKYKECQWFNF